MSESIKIGFLIVFQYGGWAIAIILGLAYGGQRKEINLLKANIAILKNHDKLRTQKDQTRDDILKMLSEILSDEKMHRDNKKKIDGLFGDLLKPWKIDGKP
jgi:hypothetical protein